MSTTTTPDFDPFDPNRKNCFLIEWRVTNQSKMQQAIQDAQLHLQKVGAPNIEVRQSCNSNNLHITLNEFTLNSPKELAIVKQIISEYISKEIPKIISEICSSSSSTEKNNNSAASASASSSKAIQATQNQQNSLPKIILEGKLNDFRKNTFFISAQKTCSGVNFLERVYFDIQALLFDAGLVPTKKPKRDQLVTHITIGRSNNNNNKNNGDESSSSWYTNLISDEYWNSNLTGISDFGELVFCSKRYGKESTPPIVMKML